MNIQSSEAVILGKCCGLKDPISGFHGHRIHFFVFFWEQEQDGISTELLWKRENFLTFLSSGVPIWGNLLLSARGKERKKNVTDGRFFPEKTRELLRPALQMLEFQEYAHSDIACVCLGEKERRKEGKKTDGERWWREGRGSMVDEDEHCQSQSSAACLRPTR